MPPPNRARYPALRHQREAPAAGAGGRQQVRLRGHRQRARRAAAYQDHPDVLVAGSEHHQQAACPQVRVLRPGQASVIPPEQAVGQDVREAVHRRQPEACRSATESRPERSSVHRSAADRIGPAA
ncbi:hypothetical protein S23_03130 [Bradyrhizobium cosmicum]|uniref:Uncharacterized protein n=1 Tax=Bradyrhizobium cosmicum TaxID=1404864 RepID=A0AAI8M823_9BRAD|nr:hypothetical protein S23_03130 [Bradyrhizobium cosmicum]